MRYLKLLPFGALALVFFLAVNTADPQQAAEEGLLISYK